MSRSADSDAGVKVFAEVRVPHETVNDDVVTIAHWRVEQGAEVRAQDIVVEIETSKAIIEVEAGADGFVDLLHPVGAEVEVGTLIANVQSQASAPEPARDTSLVGSAGGAGASVRGDSSISKKAQRLIDAEGIDPSVFDAGSLVREVDVIRYLERRAADVSTDAGAASSRRDSLLRDAYASAADRGESVLWLAWNYFWRNWLLGNLVKIAPRGIINVLHAWRGVKMGSDCFIDPTATLETAYPENITLGDDVRVTVGVIIMTHIKAPQYLRDTGLVPVTLAPVVLKDHSFIGVRAVVMPGVTVGKASVVASGAVVVSDVPDFTMVAGNPARIVKRFPRPDAK